MEKSRLFFLILAVVIVLGSCNSGNKRVAVSPPIQQVPPPQPLPIQPPAPAAPAVKPKPPDPVTALISKVDAVYSEGLEAYHAGNLSQAKLDFDKALSLLLESGMDIHSNSRLNAEFHKLVDKTYGLESSSSANGDALSQREDESPPIESFAGLTFPVDPHSESKTVC